MNLLEGVKISKSLLSKALNDPDFTFGIELEFFLVGAQTHIRQHMTKDLETNNESGDNHFVKKLGKMNWHDMLHFFTPLGVNEASYHHEHEIMNERLFDIFVSRDDDTVSHKDAVSIPRETMWNQLRLQHGVHELMTMLRAFPEGRIMGLDDNKSEAIRDIVYDGFVDEIEPFRKLNDLDIALDGVDDKKSYSLSDGHATRDAIYNLVAKELSNKLGQQVVYTTDSNYVYHVSDKHSYWALTEDGSMAGIEEQQDVVGMELISPVMNAQDGMKSLMQILQIMNEGIIGLEVQTTGQTGLHINLGVKGKDIDPVRILVLSGDNYILDKFDRATGKHSSSIQDEVQKRMRAAAHGKAATIVTPREIVQIASTILKDIKADQGDMERAVEVMNSLKPEGKEHSINFTKLASGYVEYRSIGNTDYHKRGSEIRDAVLHMIAMTYIATDPEVYRQEYLKKLYLIVQRALGSELKPGEYLDIPITASVGMIGGQAGNPGGYNSPLEDYRETSYDGENYVQYGFDSGSNTQ
jgi:hypothetical protein